MLNKLGLSFLKLDVFAFGEKLFLTLEFYVNIKLAAVAF
jgi:hypothetical protein